MKALSLTQPWASLCVAPDPLHGYLWPVKSLETRSWRVSEKLLPMRLAIHAAAGIDRQLRDAITVREHDGMRRFREPYRHALERAHLDSLDPWWMAPTGLPLGAILGAVKLVRCIPTAECERMWRRGDMSDDLYQLGDFTPGRWAWVLEKPEPLVNPIRCRGHLGLWTVDPVHVCELEEQLAHPPQLTNIDRAHAPARELRGVNVRELFG